jgi:tRNA(Ile)-lysidine synthase
LTLENQFLSFIKKNKLFDKSDKLLLALSGGKDSVLLFHLLKKTGFQFEAAHCNFGLRGLESETDQYFVEKLCGTGIKIHTKKFDTADFAQQNKISTQMAARDLRYAWFKDLKKIHNFDYLLTAHHLNDRIETFFLNISRGTGPKGLLGIPLENDFVRRPLLFCSSEQIEAYIKENQLEWTEDRSNAESKYKRNKIRHKIIPELKAINPGLEDTFAVNFSRLEALQDIFKAAFEKFKAQIIGNEISIAYLQKTAGSMLLFEEYVRPLGFTFQQVEAIFSDFKRGNSFESGSHSIYVSRLTVSILEKKERFLDLEIHTPGDYLVQQKILKIKPIQHRDLDFKNPNKIYVDAAKLKWPLKLKYWEAGDKFKPYGLKGNKLVSDILIDLKLEKTEKTEQLKLQDTEKIIWLVSRRSSELVKITDDTKEILELIFE